jgi:hypothetical protein
MNDQLIALPNEQDQSSGQLIEVPEQGTTFPLSGCDVDMPQVQAEVLSQEFTPMRASWRSPDKE